jgi:hypothetical protein
VSSVEGYPTGHGDRVRPGKQLGVAKCYPAEQGSQVRWPDTIG